MKRVYDAFTQHEKMRKMWGGAEKKERTLV
jgi:hypothetical protein